MITKSQITTNQEWISRLSNILKLHKISDKDYWFKHYGKYIFEDIRERRLEIVQTKEIRKLENKIINHFYQVAKIVERKYYKGFC